MFSYRHHFGFFDHAQLKSAWRILGGGLLLIIVVLAFYDLERVPPLWWDEGWTLTVARNWVQQGHYGRLLNGQPTPPGLEAAFPLTAAVSLSFRLFGVEVIHARLISVALMLGCLFLIHHLAKRLYNVAIAWATVACIVFMPADHALHPILAGRQVVAEIPSLFFLLGSYVCLLSIPERKGWAVILAAFMAALAINIKIQALPFWILSMLIPSLLLLFARKWRNAALFGATLVLSLALWQLLPSIWGAILQTQTYRRGILTGLYEVTALVGSMPARMFSLIVIVLFGIPTVLGLLFAAREFYRKRDWLETQEGLIRFSLFILTSSWISWYLLFSVGWIRYMFPASFVASIFVSATLYQLSNHFDGRFIVAHFLLVFREWQFNRHSLGAFLVVLLVCASLPRTLAMFYELYLRDADSSVQEVAHFLNNGTPTGSLVETYDSELFFFLNRPYHYPPDQVHVDLIRRTFLYDDRVAIGYDPLSIGFKYLVIGPHSKQWRLYDAALQSGAFRLIRRFNRYAVYERRPDAAD